MVSGYRVPCRSPAGPRKILCETAHTCNKNTIVPVLGNVVISEFHKRVGKAVENALGGRSVSQNELELGCRFTVVRCFHSQRCQVLSAIGIFGADSETFAATRFRGLRVACFSVSFDQSLQDLRISWFQSLGETE